MFFFFNGLQKDKFLLILSTAYLSNGLEENLYFLNLSMAYCLLFYFHSFFYIWSYLSNGLEEFRFLLNLSIWHIVFFFPLFLLYLRPSFQWPRNRLMSIGFSPQVLIPTANKWKSFFLQLFLTIFITRKSLPCCTSCPNKVVFPWTKNGLP